MKSRGFLIAFGMWLIVVGWLAPSRLVLRADDFGYVESAAATIQAGHWVPSEWLEPLNLPLPVLSAVGFAATGNFYLSTLGLSLLLAAVNFILLGCYLRPTLVDGVWRWGVVLGLTLLPVWLNKTVEYTGLTLGLTSTLAAWLCWRRGWYGAFFLCVGLGFLNRQSALCLLAWPAVAWLRSWRTAAKDTVGLVVGIVLVLALAGFTYWQAPPTWARTLTSARLLAGFSVSDLLGNLALAGIVLAAGQAGWNILRGEALAPVLSRNWARPAMPLLVMLIGAAVAYAGVGILWEAPGMEPFSPLIWAVLTLTAAWLCRWPSAPSAEVGLYVVGYGLLVAWRGRWWDYYFIEPLLALVFAPGVVPAAAARVRHWPVGALVAVGLVWAVLFKHHLAKAEGKTVRYEQGVRAGVLRVEEMSDAPFGYQGWKLFAVARKRPDADALIDFMKYVEGGRARYADGVVTVDRHGARKSIHPSGQNWILPADYRDRPLPLDNAEWRTYLHADRSR